MSFRITPKDVGRVAVTRNGEKCVITDYGKVLLDTAEGILLGSGSRAEFDNEGKWAINETGLDLIAWADERATDQDHPKDLRDEFAMVALQGLLSNSGGAIQSNAMNGWGFVNCELEDVTTLSYNIADAMMKARGK